MKAPWLVLILMELPDVVLGVSLCHRNDTDFGVRGQSSGEIFVRRRRSLVFPKGSALVTTLAILKAIMVKEPPNWNMIYEFDVIWPIPSQENFRKNLYRKSWIIKRRHRREIYSNFEMALNSQNLPGRQCVLRAICEAASILNQPGLSLVEKALKIILSNSEDVEETDCYDMAYRKDTNCHIDISGWSIKNETLPRCFAVSKYLQYISCCQDVLCFVNSTWKNRDLKPEERRTYNR